MVPAEAVVSATPVVPAAAVVWAAGVVALDCGGAATVVAAALPPSLPQPVATSNRPPSDSRAYL